MDVQNLANALSISVIQHPAYSHIYLDIDNGEAYICDEGTTEFRRSTRGCTDSHGYQIINFTHRGKYLKKKLHRLVYEAYVGESIPADKCRTCSGTIDHVDRDRKNNSITNLRVVTPAGNSRNRGTSSLGLPYGIVRVKRFSKKSQQEVTKYRYKILNGSILAQGRLWSSVILAQADRDAYMKEENLELPFGAV